ncbi:uncharacterized protein LOC144440057 isoform X2 [Glandiceps talaboti]
MPASHSQGLHSSPNSVEDGEVTDINAMRKCRHYQHTTTGCHGNGSNGKAGHTGGSRSKSLYHSQATRFSSRSEALCCHSNAIHRSKSYGGSSSAYSKSPCLNDKGGIEGYVRKECSPQSGVKGHMTSSNTSYIRCAGKPLVTVCSGVKRENESFSDFHLSTNGEDEEPQSNNVTTNSQLNTSSEDVNTTEGKMNNQKEESTLNGEDNLVDAIQTMTNGHTILNDLSKDVSKDTKIEEKEYDSITIVTVPVTVIEVTESPLPSDGDEQSDSSDSMVTITDGFKEMKLDINKEGNDAGARQLEKMSISCSEDKDRKSCRFCEDEAVMKTSYKENCFIKIRGKRPKYEPDGPRNLPPTADTRQSTSMATVFRPHGQLATRPSTGYRHRITPQAATSYLQNQPSTGIGSVMVQSYEETPESSRYTDEQYNIDSMYLSGVDISTLMTGEETSQFLRNVEERVHSVQTPEIQVPQEQLMLQAYQFPVQPVPQISRPSTRYEEKKDSTTTYQVKGDRFGTVTEKTEKTTVMPIFINDIVEPNTSNSQNSFNQASGPSTVNIAITSQVPQQQCNMFPNIASPPQQSPNHYQHPVDHPFSPASSEISSASSPQSAIPMPSPAPSTPASHYPDHHSPNSDIGYVTSTTDSDYSNPPSNASVMQQPSNDFKLSAYPCLPDPVPNMPTSESNNYDSPSPTTLYPNAKHYTQVTPTQDKYGTNISSPTNLHINGLEYTPMTPTQTNYRPQGCLEVNGQLYVPVLHSQPANIHPYQPYPVVNNTHLPMSPYINDNRYIQSQHQPVSDNGSELWQKVQLANLNVLTKKDEDGDTVLHISIAQRHVNLAKAIIYRLSTDSSSDLDAQDNHGQTPLHLAVLTNLTEVIEYLIMSGASVSKCNHDGNTILHSAVERGFSQSITSIGTAIMKYNEQYKPGERITLSVDCKNADGLSPLHLAVISHQTTKRVFIDNNATDIMVDNSYNMELLIRYMHADVSLPDGKAGKTALHYIAEKGDSKMMPQLFNMVDDASAIVNETMFNGNTALHLVVGSGRKEDDILKLVQILFDYGADPSIQNSEGEKAIVYAQKSHLKVKRRLRGHSQ